MPKHSSPILLFQNSLRFPLLAYLKYVYSSSSQPFPPWKCNPENECRETKLRDPIWSSNTSLISCTSDLWEHSWSATLWQYRGIKQMKENSLARAEIRWAEGERREKKHNLKSNCVMPVGSRGLQRDAFSPTRRSAPSPVWCDRVNFQPVGSCFFLPHLARAILLVKWQQKTNSMGTSAGVTLDQEQAGSGIWGWAFEHVG